MNAESLDKFSFALRESGPAESMATDPRMQRLLALRRFGRAKPPTASTGADEVAVIAKVTSVEEFEGLDDVTPGVRVGAVAEDGTSIVTARVPLTRVDRVRAAPAVLSLKPAQRLRHMLAATTPEIEARPEDLPAGSSGGAGSIVGVIDFGCDFAHHNFLDASGHTRVLKLWNQNGNGPGVPGFGYGDVYTAADIDAALAVAEPYAALGYRPEAKSHGTHVMDIAAGNGRGTGVPGVAPNADLIFVEVASTDIAWGGKDAVGVSFGDSVQLLEALVFVFESAGATPCTVNVSLGTNGGPHDGTTLVEQGIDRLLTQAPNRAVCIAGSNSFGDGIHASGTVSATDGHELAWLVVEDDMTDNELEIWYPGASSLSLDLVSPDGQVLGTVAPGQNASVSQGEEVVLFAVNRLDDPNNHDNTIGVFLSPRAASGRWVLRLRSLSGDEVPFDAWIERDDDGQSSFEAPLDNSHTVGSISCGHQSIVVGSYDAHVDEHPISSFSSAGPTRDGRPKPEVSAPGHKVVAASALSRTGTTQKSGTSMASPAVAGCVAVLLAEAARAQRDLSIDEIRGIVTQSCRSDPPAAGQWDDRYGLGRVSLAAMLDALASP